MNSQNSQPNMRRTKADRAARIAQRKIAAFEKRVGPSHLPLLYQAAFPLALTPDLLYRLWANFQRDINGTLLNVPWVAVADIILSGLCTEVGQALYEMDEAIRSELLSRLQSNPNFGQQRIQELSDFLLEYTRKQLQSNDLDTRDFAQAQKWTVLAYTRPGEAAHDLASTFQKIGLEATQSGQHNKTELVRMAALVETFADPLGEAELQPLLTYANGIASWAKGDAQAATVQLEPMADAGKIKIAGVDLPIPDDIRTHSKTFNLPTGADYRGQRLRGRSFKGQDLSGANFSNADIRGTDFTQATLTGANFTQAKMGLQRRWVSVLIFLSLSLTIMSGMLATAIGTVVGVSLFSTLSERPLSTEGMIFTSVGSIGFIVFWVLCLVTLKKTHSPQWNSGALGLIGSLFFAIGIVVPIVLVGDAIDGTSFAIGALITLGVSAFAVAMGATIPILVMRGKGTTQGRLMGVAGAMGGLIALALGLIFFFSSSDFTIVTIVALGILATLVEVGLFWFIHWLRRLSSLSAFISGFTLFVVLVTGLIMGLNQVEWFVIAFVGFIVAVVVGFLILPFVVTSVSPLSGTLMGAGVVPVAIALFCVLIWVSSSSEVWTASIAVGEISLLMAATAWATIIMTAISVNLTWADADNKAIALLWTLLGSIPLIVGAVVCIFLMFPFLPALGVNHGDFFLATGVGVIMACWILGIGIYIGWQALAGAPKFSSIRDLALAFAAQGGTSFRGADLTGADFTEATLKGADFREANLTQVCWFHVQQLDHACIENSYLHRPKVQQLVVTGIGQAQTFDHLNLAGINLQNISLADASFIGANLTDTNLRNADLSRARLVNAQLDGANLLGACLTGAYLNNVKINNKTQLKSTECQYIFTKLPTKNNPDPGRIPTDYRQILKPGELLTVLNRMSDR